MFQVYEIDEDSTEDGRKTEMNICTTNQVNAKISAVIYLLKIVARKLQNLEFFLYNHRFMFQ